LFRFSFPRYAAPFDRTESQGEPWGKEPLSYGLGGKWWAIVTSTASISSRSLLGKAPMPGAPEAAPAPTPLAVAVLVVKDVRGVLYGMRLPERQKQEQVEEEHRPDREWQFSRVNRLEYERGR
jgi:hypothetical protein